MGGVDTKGRYHVHWGAAETYGERREESALRRSGRPVPDPAYTHFEPDRPGGPSTRSSHDARLRPEARCSRSSRRPRTAYGYLPVAALKRISYATGAWYAMVYGTATYYDHLRFEPPAASRPSAAARLPCRARAGAGDRGRLATDSAAQPDGRPAERLPATALDAAPLVTLDGEPQPTASGARPRPT